MAKKGKLLPAYLVVGADELKRTKTVTHLKRYLEEGLDVFNLEEITASGDTDAADLVASLNTMPVGNGPRIVIVYSAEKLPKPASEAIISYLSNPNPSCTLLVCSESLKKNTRLYKALAKVGPRSVIDCTPATRRDLPKEVSKLAAAYHLSIGWDAATALVDRVGDSTTMIDNQLKMLSQLKGGMPGTVTAAEIEEHVARTVEVKPWEFLKMLSARDLTRSLQLYGTIRKQWQRPDYERTGLLVLVTGRVRELICARSLDGRGESRSLAQTLGKKDWQVKGYTLWARAFGPGELEGCLAECAACERTLKSSSDDPDLAMISLITKICGRA
ncbi:MAG: DNA polymerase III subunit delta [Tractidigestivibacter sp.]|jgi:DNA polymerase-3 subunit delta|uniref:DNA polymerase III subunit delta n=1 Tax=Tractidigestivibacter sp. TaxID=2847320 RepID=UPI003D91631B